MTGPLWKPTPKPKRPRAWGSSLPTPSKPMGRSGAPKRGKGMPRKNAARAAKLREVQFGADGKREWIVSLPCATCGHPAPSEPSHGPTGRGAGGGPEDMIPQCPSNPATGREGCHDALHRLGPRTFEATFGCDLQALADRYEAEWRTIKRQEAAWSA